MFTMILGHRSKGMVNERQLSTFNFYILFFVVVIFVVVVFVVVVIAIFVIGIIIIIIIGVIIISSIVFVLTEDSFDSSLFGLFVGM